MLRRTRVSADVRIEVPPRDFDVALVRAHRVLLWSWVRVVRRRIRVVALPLRDLLLAHERLRLLSEEMHGLEPREALYAALSRRVTPDALRLTDDKSAEIWKAWQELNRLSLGARAAATAPTSSGARQNVVDVVLRLQRWPFNFSADQVLSMSAGEAVERISEWERLGARELGLVPSNA